MVGRGGLYMGNGVLEGFLRVCVCVGRGRREGEGRVATGLGEEGFFYGAEDEKMARHMWEFLLLL